MPPEEGAARPAGAAESAPRPGRRSPQHRAKSSSTARRWTSRARRRSSATSSGAGSRAGIARARQPAAARDRRQSRAARSTTCCASSTSRRSAAGPAGRSPTRTRPGAADLNLALAVPLTRPAETTASSGSLVLAGQRHPDDATTRRLLAAAKGRIDFSQRGFTVSGASARVLGGDLASKEVERGPERRRRAALQRPRHRHRRGAAPGERARHRSPASRRLVDRPDELSGDARLRRRPGRRSASRAIWSASPSTCLRRSARLQRRRCRCAFASAPKTPLAGPGEPAPPLRETLAARCRRGAAGALRSRDERRRDARRARRGTRRRRAAGAAGARRRPLPSEPIEVPPLPASGVAANVVVKKLDVDAWQTALGRIQNEDGHPAPRRRQRGAARVRCRGRRGLFPGHDRPARRRARSRLAPPRQRHRRPVPPTASSGAPTSAPTSSRATSSTGRRAAMPAGAGRVYARLVAPEPAQGRGRARREPARFAAGEHSWRSTSPSTTSSCAASISAGSRSRPSIAPIANREGAREWQLPSST